jgi:hypothetical protein
MTTFFLVLLGIIVASSLVFAASLLRLSLDDADFWLKVFSGLLAALIFTVGLAALVTGHFAGQAQAEKIKMQSEKILGLEKGVTDARTKQAEAERALLEVKDRISPRLKSGEQLTKIKEYLKDKPRGRVEIRYQSGDFEAYTFAENIVETLPEAGWIIDPPGIHSMENVLFQLMIRSSNSEDARVMALYGAFRFAGFQIGAVRDVSVPPDNMILIFGQQRREPFREPTPDNDKP